MSIRKICKGIVDFFMDGVPSETNVVVDVPAEEPVKEEINKSVKKKSTIKKKRNPRKKGSPSSKKTIKKKTVFKKKSTSKQRNSK